MQGDYRLESGYAAMAALLERGERPTAVVAASDLMAIGAINAALDRGLRVPQEISVVGFDNIWFAATVRPALTTVAQPMYSIGAKAVELLAGAMDEAEPQAPATHWIEPHLVVRASTAPVHEKTADV